MELHKFLAQLLGRHGCLVEESDDGALQVLFPSSLQRQLQVGEMDVFRIPREKGQALTFIHGGRDFIESLGPLALERGKFSAVSFPDLNFAVKDPEKLLASHLTVQNGIFRIKEMREGKGSYLVVHFSLTATADTRMERLLAVAVNEQTGTVPVGMETQIMYLLDRYGAEGREKDRGGPEVSSEELARSLRTAQDLASLAAQDICGEFIDNLNRRLERDLRRLQAYYLTLAQEIERRLLKKKNDPEEADRALSRLEATRADYLKKIQDARDKYALDIVLEPVSVLRVELPLTILDVTLQRRKERRLVSLPVNPAIRGLESLVCENCRRPVLNFYLCDALHVLCAGCFPACSACGQ
ncbi:MAG TPA: hypothetical protein P5308_00340 [Syntrophales bacterium]|nr:hypothetical protein [Syntrophales bacterium]